MFPAAAPTPSLGALLSDAGWTGPLVLAVAAGLITLLAWQLWRSRRHFLMELAEQARQVAEEQEKAAEARREKEAIARESQAKSELLATLSRESRGHLNGIIGSADLMLETSLKPAQRGQLTRLRASAEALNQSLNEVLDYSSIETGQIRIAREPFDLRHPLIEVVESLSPMALLKGLELVLILAADVPLPVTGDAVRLRQVLLNLMSNAVKFTASGRVVLRVELATGSAAPSGSGATWMHFSVSDTSPGIPEEMQATIFDRFAETDAPSPRKFGGSGIELAISKRLVELMGGKIGARSLAEGGSEFWVVLPLAVEKAAPVPAAVAPPRGCHVVVLDGLAAARVAASAMLARLGVDHDATDTLGNAEVLLRDALEDDEEEVRNVVLLLDEKIARESGDQLAGLLAPDSALSVTRVVLLSRNPEDVAVDALSYPLAAVLRKPLLRTEVLAEALKPGPPMAAAKPMDSRAPFDLNGGVASGATRGRHVLVVDDDEISRFVCSQLLMNLGCAVEVATSGGEAVDRAQSGQFDLIFMDCQMPEMDGYTATEKIRAVMGDEAPPIVAQTANVSARDREKCSAVGMCDFIGKPVRKPELARVLKRWTRTEASG